MGFLGVILLVIVAIVCYNIWFNFKYTEGEQIMMRHKKEKVQREKISKKVNQHLRNEYFTDDNFNSRNTLFNTINENFTDNHKSTILVMLYIISTEFSGQKRIKQRQYIHDLHKKFNLRDNLIDTVLYHKNHSLILKQKLEAFEKQQILYQIFFLMDMFVLDGGLEDDKVEIIQNKIVDYFNITHDEFNSFVEKVYELRLFYN